MTHPDGGPAETDQVITRRRILQAVGAGGTVALAGCLHDEEPCRLSVSKEHAGGSVTYGGTTAFEITVCNEGDEQCSDGVTVTDDLPAGTTFDSVSGTDWTASANGGVVTCEHPNAGGLGGGDCLPTLTLTLQVGQPAEAGPELANCATVEQGDADTGQNTDCATVPVEPLEGDCDLAISKSYEGDVVVEGSVATFQIEVCNDGDGVCADPVTVVDGLPSGVTFDSGTGSGWSLGQSGGSVVATHDNSGGLDPGECLPVLELTLGIGPMSETGDAIRNCATLKVDDSNSANDVDCVNVPVRPAPGECDLSVTKTHAGGGVVTAGEPTTFEIVVCNQGDGDCDEQVTVTDDLPGGVTYTSATGTGWSVSENGGIVTATHGNGNGLTPGDCLPTLTLEVDTGSIDETGDQITNCVSIDGSDVNTQNDRDCEVVTVTQPIEGCNGLEIEKVAATQFTYGEQEAYEITVCNPTSQQCDGQITVTDTLPAGISLVSVSGSNWSASASGGVVTATHPNNGDLTPGSCLPTLTVTVELVEAEQFPGGSDAVQNCAQLIADGVTVDESCVSHVIFNI